MIAFIWFPDASISAYKKIFGSDSMDQHVRITTAAALENAAKQKVKHAMACG